LDLDAVWFPDPFAEVLPIPYFVTVWDVEHRKHPFLPEFVGTGWTWQDRENHYRRVLPPAARIFVGTEEGRRELGAFFGVHLPNVIVNRFAVQKFGPMPAYEDCLDRLQDLGLKPGFLFYPAQFWPHKNHINLVRALNVLKSRHGISIDLVLTGSGNADHLEKEIARLGMQSSVHRLGFVDLPTLSMLYLTARALVYCSLFGPDNLPPLEAFVHGCPVLASDVPGSSEHLDGGAILFNPADPVDIADKIALMLVGDQLRDKLIERGREIVQSRTPQAHAAVFINALDEFESIRAIWN
jgi:glycosyltransferase involved in cell wall biosynthesis